MKVKNYVVTAHRRIKSTNWGWKDTKSEGDIYETYHELCIQSLSSTRHFLEGDWEYILFDEDIENIDDAMPLNNDRVYELWHKEPCNILWVGPDVQFVKPTKIFGMFNEFRLFNWTDPKKWDAPNQYNKQFENLFNNDLQYYPHTMDPELWAIERKMRANWNKKFKLNPLEKTKKTISSFVLGLKTLKDLFSASAGYVANRIADSINFDTKNSLESYKTNYGKLSQSLTAAVTNFENKLKDKWYFNYNAKISYYNTQQIVHNTMFWHQELPWEDAHRPTLFYQAHLLPWHSIEEQDAWNGCKYQDAHVVHWHSSRHSPTKLECMKQVNQALGVPIVSELK